MSATGSVDAFPATPAEPADLHIRLLGSFECLRDGAPIPREAWRTRPTLIVFKLLLDERERTLTFERLIDSVWPDSDPQAARHSLRVAIRTLRRVLEPELAQGAASRFVRTEPGGYRLDPSSCNIDVDAFLAARQRARSNSVAMYRRRWLPIWGQSHSIMASTWPMTPTPNGPSARVSGCNPPISTSSTGSARCWPTNASGSRASPGWSAGWQSTHCVRSSIDA